MSMGVDRRDFIKIAGAGVASGALASCSPPRTEEKIIPHVIPPVEQIPGQEVWYNSTCNECGAGCGISVRNREGRALRIAGNPKHPVSKGGVCVQGHSTLQATYHPDRYRGPLVDRKQADWTMALQEAGAACSAGKVAILTGNLATGTLDELFDEFAQAIGAVRAVWEPIQYAPLAAASEIVLGAKVLPNYLFKNAGYILSVGADFLETWLNPVANQHGYSQSHGYKDGKMAKLVHLEPRLGLTAANADEWLPTKPGSEFDVLAGVLRALIDAGAPGIQGADKEQTLLWLGDASLAKASQASGIAESALRTIVNELVDLGPGLVVAGGAATQGTNATQVHMAALLINKAIGSVGITVDVGVQAYRTHRENVLSLRQLLDKIDAGEIETLLVYRSNPAYDATGALKAVERLRKVKHLIALDALPNETTALATLVLPDHTPLESWGDHRSFAGVDSLQQPAMNPLFQTKAVGDTLIELATAVGSPLKYPNFLVAIQQKWSGILSKTGQTWKNAVQYGGSWAAEPDSPKMATLPVGQLGNVPASAAEFEGNGDLTLVAYPHIHRYDGRFANRGWCQEIPDPIMCATWSHWVEVHPTTAAKLGIKHKDAVSIETSAGRLETFAYITTGVLPEVIATPLGQGHGAEIGRFGAGIEGNVYTILPEMQDKTTGANVLAGAKAKLSLSQAAKLDWMTGTSLDLVTTDGRRTDLGRGIGQVVALNKIAKIDAGAEPREKVPHHGTHVINPDGNYPPHDYPEYRWGMSIDLSSCTGCGACVAACYSENNIPLVGKEQVAIGREMSWLRIERYFDSADDARKGVQFVPMLCQHCGNAPCEPVCPVFATYHTVEGLNGMVYNRCVGTRYCGNNCSYKVRRYNYYGWGDPHQEQYAWPEPMTLMLNPDVSVRSGGVMEKCTFCVQIIRDKTESARMTGARVGDGEVQTACQASCPSQSIVFGNLNDPESKVAKLAKQSNRSYKILEVLNTQPAVTYHKRVRHTKTTV